MYVYLTSVCVFERVSMCVLPMVPHRLTPKFFFLSSSSLPLRLRQILLCRQTLSAAAMATTTSQVSLSLSLSYWEEAAMKTNNFYPSLFPSAPGSKMELKSFL